LDAVSPELPEMARAPVIKVLTKSDLVSNSTQIPGIIQISTLSGAGIPELLSQIQAVVAAEHPTEADAPLLTRTRHLHAVTSAASELESFRSHWRDGKIPVTVAAIHVRAAVDALEELIGFVDVEHVLDRVFSSFCVGK
jgi:tRNA modification GTPase